MLGARLLRDALGARLLRFTPGISLASEGGSDQARTATPAQAIRAGATQIVPGRSVTQATVPSAAFAAVGDEVGTAASHPHFC